MNLKKEIDVQEHVANDCKNMSINQLEALKDLTDQGKQLHAECVSLSTKCQSQELELKCNEETIAKNHDLLNMLNEKYQDCSLKVAEADTEICKQRDVLMKLDEELNFLETCNDRHKTSQAHLTENLHN